jgi:hypothetical protein
MRQAMRRKVDSIEVFQDLFLTAHGGGRQQLRDALRQHAKAPWRYSEEHGRMLGDDMITFEREAGGEIHASALTLWERPDSFAVANIVPKEISELGITGYNDVLNDFVSRVVEPALNESTFSFNVGKREQCISDWTSQQAARALSRFSATANKSTGASHPSDQQRWFEFLFAVHRATREVDTHTLGRWLVEVEQWPSEIARDLMLEYELGIALLKAYDRSN